MNARVVAAIAAIKKLDPVYWSSTLSQRLSGGAGSTVDGVSSTEELEAKLMASDWQPYSHPAIMAGCVAFSTEDISGKYGVIQLSELNDSEILTVDDRKNTGIASLTVTGKTGSNVGFTVIIIGEENSEEIVFTFHHGEPVQPSTVEVAGKHGQAVTVAEAKSLGFTTAKIVA